MTPWLILLAGPNGSGKSSLARQPDFSSKIATAGAVFLNPDELAKLAPDGTNPLIWSGREMHRLVTDFTATQKSFMVETTLSGNNHFRTVERCKAAGYKLSFSFVFVSSLRLANERVRLRVSQGGHDVPEEDQARRYEKSLGNAARIIERADEAFIYRNDNFTGHELIAVYENGKSLHKTQNLKWLP
jgi:predicted ABC-type ATPase